MTTAWTRGIAVGLLAWTLGCEVHVNDGPLDGDAGTFGGRAGQGGRAGASGSAGQGGSAGGMSGAGGSMGGSGGSTSFPAPTCSPESMDANDECVQCLKQKCCTEWLGCDDQTCFDEWTAVVECVVMEPEFSVGEAEYGMCISESSADMSGLVAANSTALLECLNFVPEGDAGAGASNCGEVCFGYDIFFE